MSTIAKTGNELQLESVEESVPYDTWLSWLKNLAIMCIESLHISKCEGNSYSAVDFWKIMILSALLALSFDEAADQLNDVLWKELHRHQRRKIQPRRLGGRGVRHDRLCPNGDQTRKYRNTLPAYVVRTLNRIIFDAQLQYAENYHLISNKLTILVDNTQEWYYGKDRYPQNPFITGGHNGPGTNRKRNYLGIMAKSGSTFLYVGVEAIKKGVSEVPFIMANLDHLIQLGYTIDKVLADRWFPTYEMFAELDVRGISYIGPYKKYAPIKRIIESYLKNGGQYIITYTIKGAPAKYYHSPHIQVTLILTNRRGRRLREVREDFLSGKVSLKDSLKEIFVIITNIQPPRGKKAQQGWAVKICHAYDPRWNIETGFRDLNRIGEISNARKNVRKFFMFSLRFWVFNMWHLERAKRFRQKNVPKSWRKGPTLRTFGYKVALLEDCK
jgi:hypothetical protein